jgi:hypothetical protein
MRIIVLPVEDSERPGVSHNGYPAILCDKAEIYLVGDRPVKVNVLKNQFLRHDLSRYPEGQSDICPYCGTPNEQDGVSLRNGHDCYYCGSN